MARSPSFYQIEVRDLHSRRCLRHTQSCARFKMSCGPLRAASPCLRHLPSESSAFYGAFPRAKRSVVVSCAFGLIARRHFGIGRGSRHSAAFCAARDRLAFVAAQLSRRRRGQLHSTSRGASTNRVGRNSACRVATCGKNETQELFSPLRWPQHVDVYFLIRKLTV